MQDSENGAGTGNEAESGKREASFLESHGAAGIYLLGILTESILNPAVLQTFLGML